ncbi:hypothetical protein [Pasteurella sp. PK-2025]|uniref:hypothetical protein n=1 Tax=unclassified Pasteurella TaxID=2621516 RepID=UPI003C72AA04
MKEFKEGSVFFIPDIEYARKKFSFNKKYRLGKLIYISRYFKNMIGFLPSKDVFESAPDDISEVEFLDYVIYTGNSELKNGNWEIIGHHNILEKEILLTKRRVGNVIMIRDEQIRICTEDDYTKYKNQGIAGFGALHYLLMNL